MATDSTFWNQNLGFRFHRLTTGIRHREVLHQDRRDDFEGIRTKHGWKIKTWISVAENMSFLRTCLGTKKTHAPH